MAKTIRKENRNSNTVEEGSNEKWASPSIILRVIIYYFYLVLVKLADKVKPYGGCWRMPVLVVQFHALCRVVYRESARFLHFPSISSRSRCRCIFHGADFLVKSLKQTTRITLFVHPTHCVWSNDIHLTWFFLLLFVFLLLAAPPPAVDECSTSDSDKTLDVASTANLLSPYHS